MSYDSISPPIRAQLRRLAHITLDHRLRPEDIEIAGPWQPATYDYTFIVQAVPAYITPRRARDIGISLLDDRAQRLYGCWCVRQIWHLLEDVRSQHAVEAAEAYAQGSLGVAELLQAQSDASDVVWIDPPSNDEAVRVAAWAAARIAVLEDAEAAAMAAAVEAARAARIECGGGQ